MTKLSSAAEVPVDEKHLGGESCVLAVRSFHAEKEWKRLRES
jgi:hypothetical protein